MAKKSKVKKATEPVSGKVWVSDPYELVSVEKKRQSILMKQSDGTFKGGTEYYGEKK